ncbi:lymphatic vessel endothelial hyaluronic acid receptor 1a [Odontesthes bonariensis]|uniref:lymphatic vessel endothelial hyaluronic acid receptor 1a n=1 Tax=Odontesthes bonariensis TaxID=219752 RepID=UPI003F581433
MNIIWLCIASALAIASVSSDQNMTHISVFPSVNQSIAGVIQVSGLNEQNQLHYAFNASEARRLCHSLRLSIASKAQVEEALSRGLETCRFGWIDEHFAVIPRVHALANCGKNRTGLVKWRAAVTHKFDVFCFNESDAVTQLKDTATDSPSSSGYNSEPTRPTSRATKSPLTTQSTSTSSHPPTTTNSEAEPARFVGSVHNSAGAKAVLITCSCGLLLISVAILAYLKLTRRCSQSSDVTQQQEYIQTEEWECAKTITETKKVVSEDERIEVDDSAH